LLGQGLLELFRRNQLLFEKQLANSNGHKVLNVHELTNYVKSDLKRPE
jgi:hypothetical protein